MINFSAFFWTVNFLTLPYGLFMTYKLNYKVNRKKNAILWAYKISIVQFSCSVVSNSL